MKKQLYLFTVTLLVLTQAIVAQSPQGMNYQAIARNSSGAILANQNIGIRFTITDGVGGAVLYQETNSISTNQFGLFTLIVGNGTPVSGIFSAIPWATVTPWLMVELDPAGGTTYVNMGTSQLLSVPYALMAKEVETSDGWNLSGNNGTVPGSNFLGTLDNQSLMFKTNNILSGTIDPNFPYNTSLGFQTLVNNTSGVENVAIGSGAMLANTAGYDNTAVGATALASNDGFSNTAIGHSALQHNESGNFNTALGKAALDYNISGMENTATGDLALLYNLTGSRNTATGNEAISSNTTGSFNTGFGHQALKENTAGNSNVAIGTNTLYHNTDRSNLVAVGDSALFFNGTGVTQYWDATNNTALGSKALYTNTTGNDNTASGSNSLYSNTSGYENTANGAYSLHDNISGHSNAAFGLSALLYNSTGSNNTACGKSAIMNSTSGYDNTGIGREALGFTTSGWQNTSVGSLSLTVNYTGSYNTAIGYNTGPNSGNLYNTTCLGIDATALSSNSVRLGNTLVTSIQGQVAFTTYSDGRFKEKVREDVPGLSFISQLRPVTYRVNREKLNEFIGLNEKRNKIGETNPDVKFLTGDTYSEVTTGFIAQEVEEAAKNVGFEFSGVDTPENSKDIYGLRYATFVVPLVKAVQELNEENQELKKEIALIKAVLTSGQQVSLEEMRATVNPVKDKIKEQKAD